MKCENNIPMEIYRITSPLSNEVDYYHVETRKLIRERLLASYGIEYMQICDSFDTRERDYSQVAQVHRKICYKKNHTHILYSITKKHCIIM